MNICVEKIHLGFSINIDNFKLDFKLNPFVFQNRKQIFYLLTNL